MLEEALLTRLLDAELVMELLALLDELDDAVTLLELDEVVVPAYEHQAEVVKLFAGKLLDEHATLLVKVP